MRRRRCALQQFLFRISLLLSIFFIISPRHSVNAQSIFVPTLRDVPELVTDINTAATFTIILGHTKPGYDLSLIVFQIISGDKSLLIDSQITIRGTGSNKIVSALPTIAAGALVLHNRNCCGHVLGYFCFLIVSISAIYFF